MMERASEEKIKKAREYALKRGSATLLLTGANHTRYGSIKNQMQQNMAMGTNNLPVLIHKTMNTLNTFAKTNKNIFGRRQDYKVVGTEVAFAQIQDLSAVTCYHCGEKGH